MEIPLLLILFRKKNWILYFGKEYVYLSESKPDPKTVTLHTLGCNNKSIDVPISLPDSSVFQDKFQKTGLLHGIIKIY